MASGNTMAIFTPLHNVPPPSNFATLDLRNGHPVLRFDPDTAQAAVFSGKLPKHYSGGGLNILIEWAADGVIAGAVKWNTRLERIEPGVTDLDADDFAAAQTVTDAAPGTDGFTKVSSIPFAPGAPMDGLLAGESFRLKITRDAADPGDTMAADAELVSVEIREA